MSVRGICLFIATAALVSVVLAASPADAKKEKVWVVKELPSLTNWAGTLANDISDSGYIGGIWVDSDAGHHAAYWYKGKAYDLEDEIGIPDGMTNSLVYSINSGGLMGGIAMDEYGARFATLWNTKKDKVKDLHPDEDYPGSAILGVNSSGRAVGYVITESSNPYPGVAWVWPKGDTTGSALPLGDYIESLATGVNSSGTISGFAYDEYYSIYAVAWTKGKKGEYTLQDIHGALVDDDEDIVMSIAWDVGEDGTVLGQALDTTYKSYAFAWSLSGGLEFLEDDDADRAIAWKKDSKYIAGGIGVFESYWGNVSDDAVVWVKGDLAVLPDLDDFPMMESASVNGSGTVVGFGYAKDDKDLLWPRGWYAEKQ